MRNREALVKAREVIAVNLLAHRSPARAEIDQLVDAYPMTHAVMVLDNLIKLFPEETGQ